MKRKPIDLAAHLAPVFEEVARLPAADQARAAHDMWKQLIVIQGQIARLRSAAVRKLRETHTQRECADLLDVSVTRIRQMEDNGTEEVVAGK